jgi:hypothetical protein
VCEIGFAKESSLSKGRKELVWGKDSLILVVLSLRVKI